jgi:GTP-binding protein Era
VALVGAPNAGKSQLLNVLTQSTISAVSRKRHTTRSDVLGARTLKDETTQIVFKDTPGFLRIENAKAERLDRDLIATAAAELQTVDYSLLVVDAARTLNDTYTEALEMLMKGALDSRGRIEEDFDDDDYEDDNDEDDDEEEEEENDPFTSIERPKFAIVLNKVDLVKDKTSLLELAMHIGALADRCLSNKYADGKEVDFETMIKVAPVVFYVSALKEDGVDDILNHLVELATPCRSWPVEPGQSTTLTPLEQVEELIREKLYRCLHREVPHSIRQENRMFREVPQGMIIHQDLVVFSKSHKKLVMGGAGNTLQRIEDGAVRDLKKLFGCEVALRLHVKIGKTKNVRSADEYYERDNN